MLGCRCSSLAEHLLSLPSCSGFNLQNREDRGGGKGEEEEKWAGVGERSKGGKEEKERKEQEGGVRTYSQSPKEYLQEIMGKIQEIFHTHSWLIAGYKQPNNDSQISTLVNVTLSEFLLSFEIRNKTRITPLNTDIQPVLSRF